jgi:hypothetical protein
MGLAIIIFIRACILGLYYWEGFPRVQANLSEDAGEVFPKKKGGVCLCRGS